MELNDIFVRVTDITDYIFCPRKVYLKRVLGYSEEDTEQKIFGSIVHSLFDKVNEKEKEIIFNIKEFVEYEKILNLYNSFLIKLLEESIKEFEEQIKNL
ncbi:MAG: CRISPR-associated protein Cas4, partial [Candidatus Nanopusillus sp.]